MVDNNYHWPNVSASIKDLPVGAHATVQIFSTFASGVPTITGQSQVKQELTADTSGITDPDGNTGAENGDSGYAYTYQWIRVDSSSNETTITGATAATYPLVTADVDHTIEVQVSFTDDDDNPEGPITSDAFPSSGTVVAATATACPTGYDWCSELTVGTFVDTDKSLTLYGYIADATTTGALANTRATIYGVTCTVTEIVIMVPDGTPTTHSVLVRLDKLVPRGTVFNLGGMEFTTDEASENATSNSYLWTAPTSFSWTDGQKVTVSAEGPANSVATGAPTISGAPQVGETLTAGTSGITDANGLTDATFVYQWIRVDSDGTTNAADIGTDSSTYVVVAEDLGKKIKVEVSFTDDDDNVEEPLESDAYPASGTVVAAKTDWPRRQRLVHADHVWVHSPHAAPRVE